MTVGSALPNEAMAEAWDAEADGWLENAERYERISRRLVGRFLDSTPVSAASQVLDIGCGAGESTITLARRASNGHAVGLDISRRMLDHARASALSAGVTNVTFEFGDAQVHDFGATRFDVAVSVFGAMFFVDPVEAMTNVRRSLRPGASLGLLVWRELGRNEWITALRSALAPHESPPQPPPDVPGPFALAREPFTRSILERAGFEEIHLEAIDDPMDMGADAEDAFPFVQQLPFTTGLIAEMEPGDRSEALARLRRSLEEHSTPDGVLYGSSAWIITASAPVGNSR